MQNDDQIIKMHQVSHQSWLGNDEYITMDFLDLMKIEKL